MCVIIVKDNNRMLEKSSLVTAEEMNEDGLGIIWLDSGEVQHTDSSDWHQLLTDRPFIAHFRYATVGAVNPENTHPYRIGDGPEWLMMNGTIPGLGNTKVSDTKALAKILSKTPKKKWASKLGKYHTVRFLTYNEKSGAYKIYNRSLWSKVGDVWYSKTLILEANRIAVYGTLKYGNGNYYNYLSGSSSFLGDGETLDRYPMICEGIPYVVDSKGLGHHIDVDVFNVDNKTLESIDGLEGHPDWYRRKKVPVRITGGRIVMAWLYFNDVKDWDKKPWHKTYIGHSYSNSYYPKQGVLGRHYPVKLYDDPFSDSQSSVDAYLDKVAETASGYNFDDDSTNPDASDKRYQHPWDADSDSIV